MIVFGGFKGKIVRCDKKYEEDEIPGVWQRKHMKSRKAKRKSGDISAGDLRNFRKEFIKELIIMIKSSNGRAVGILMKIGKSVVQLFQFLE